MAQARLTETVDLPTPPLPLAMAITRFTCGGRSASSALGCDLGSEERLAPLRTRVTPGPGARAAAVSTTWALSTPGTAFSAFSAASRT